MKDIEIDRTLTMLEKNIEATVDGDVGPHNLVVCKVSNLCEDLVDDEVADLDDNVDHLISEKKIKKTRKKKVYAISSVRRSTRVRNQRRL